MNAPFRSLLVVDRICEVRPITADDLDDVGLFLHRNLNRRLSPARWASYIKPSWSVDAPDHGFMLVSKGKIVGVYAAFYADRVIDGQRRRFCNLSAWAVRDEFRGHGLRLVRALLSQRDVHFTDLSPSGNVVGLNARMKFRTLDTAATLAPNLPWPVLNRSIRIVVEPRDMVAMLGDRERRIYEDHARAAAAHHLVIQQGTETCYLMFRRTRLKRLPLFASILYVSNSELFRRAARHVHRHLLLRHGIPFTLAELRIAGTPQPSSILLRSIRPKMYRSDVLSGREIDDLYSELTCIPW